MNVPKDLADKIDQGNCVVFVGAGLSQGAGLPGWPGLLRQMLDWGEEHGVDLSDRAELEKCIKDGELLMVAEEMRKRLGKNDFREFMVGVFRKPNLEPTDAHNLLPKIPFAAALTSNYDTLLETAYTISSGGIPRVFTHEDYPELSAAPRDNEFYVLKVHGTIDRIETIILGQSDYRELIHDNQACQSYLRNLFLNKTVFFIGFGLTDPDLMLLLDKLSVTFKGYAGKHYALMDTEKAPAFKQRLFEENYNIKIIPYTKSAPDHPEVREFLSDLAEKCSGCLATTGEVIPTLGKRSNVPNLPAHFLPRPDDLNALKNAVLADVSTPVVVTGRTRSIGVHGMGGIGKSVLAAALARDDEVRSAFPDGVIWLTIGQEPAITSRQRQLALALGDEPSAFEDEQQGKARLSELLADKACLVILDDVWEVKHAAAFNVLGAQCRMLVTTRDARIIF